jgi:hypothetical protein
MRLSDDRQHIEPLASGVFGSCGSRIWSSPKKRIPVGVRESWRTHDPEVPFSEFDWATPQELRLIASLILCEVMEGPCVRLYPLVRFSPWLGRLSI